MRSRCLAEKAVNHPQPAAKRQSTQLATSILLDFATLSSSCLAPGLLASCDYPGLAERCKIASYKLPAFSIGSMATIITPKIDSYKSRENGPTMKYLGRASSLYDARELNFSHCSAYKLTTRLRVAKNYTRVVPEKHRVFDTGVAATAHFTLENDDTIRFPY